MSPQSAPSLSLHDAIRPVVNCLSDGQIGLEKIGEALQDPTLKRYFFDESLTRSEFLCALESISHHKRVHDIEETGSASATRNRMWPMERVKLGNFDQSLLATAEHDQFAATKAYAHCLEHGLPFSVRQTILAQAAAIEHFHEFLHSVRKANKTLAGN